ncbi:glycoside hydrolase family 88/105 protein [Reichenbachiella ulvae]|uniref:Glycoside hydrolase family 88 protein n=1 Tax=Reichenbachiella ulvae TaxID=2980104 RepID=A0ABT3D0D7_9BACT|nr:glycoside hydrolase family 88 protein [Reichenbachiella ulvae]MCV9388918.1 glycoside hydrolase family 88 protein [Reichenbachiella ulvae]
MKTPISYITLAIVAILTLKGCQSPSNTLPTADKTLEIMQLTNQYFMDKWPDTGAPIVGRKTWPSHIWTRGVYYEGLMALYSVDPKDKYYDYAVSWSEAHDWSFRYGITTRNADNQCAGQTYLDLYEIDPQPQRIDSVKASIDSMMVTDKIDDWDWIDAIQMAMPVYSRLGRILKDSSYFERMYAMYDYSKNIEGENGLYNPEDGLWWRDADYDPPYTEPNGEDCYWSRGNGWVVAALVRVLEDIPADEPHRDEYLADLKAMLEAAVKVQREDGFWNASLHDPNNYGGPETTGTSLFVYGMAWGLNQNILDSATYHPVVTKAWNAMLDKAVHPDGFLGYVQSTGKEPSTGQPLSYDKVPDFEDYGLGCFLLAGSEVYKLSL